MIWVTIVFFLFSGIWAYFALKIKMKYEYNILINLCLLASCWLWLLLTDISELSILLVLAYTFLIIIGVIAHFVTPLILNSLGSCLSKLTQQSFSPKTYNELLDDGYRMYFCVLLFSTIKNFSLIMFIAASLNLIK